MRSRRRFGGNHDEIDAVAAWIETAGTKAGTRTDVLRVVGRAVAAALRDRRGGALVELLCREGEVEVRIDAGADSDCIVWVA